MNYIESIKIPKGQFGWLSTLWNKGIKTVAHAINEHGNTPYDDSYEQFKKTNLGYGYGSQRSMEIDRKARDWYKQKYPNDKSPSGNIFSQSYLNWMRKVREAYTKDQYNGESGRRWKKHRNGSPSKTAAGVAVGGAIVGAFPHPVTKVIGGLMSVPDIIYDWSALIDEPKPSNAAHAATNHLEDVAKVATPGWKYDDYVAKGLGILGNVDDASSAADYDIFSWINKK